MDDLTQRLQSLLNDPESMKNLSELAQMMGQSESHEATPPTEDAAPLPDLGKLLAAGQLLGSQPPDANAALILALKPHLSQKRAQRAEKAVRMLKLYQMAGVLRESGLLNTMLGSS